MAVKRKVKLFDKDILSVLKSWSAMRGGKVKESSDCLRQLIVKYKDLMEEKQVDGVNSSKVPLLLERNDNNLAISFSDVNTSIFVNIWETTIPQHRETFKNIVYTMISQIKFINLKTAALAQIPANHNFFYYLLDEFVRSMEKEGYLLIDVLLNNDCGYITADIRKNDIRIGFRLYQPSANKMINVDFNYEHHTLVADDKQVGPKKIQEEKKAPK